METIIFKRISGGWMFCIKGDPSSAMRYFYYAKREAFRLFKQKYGIARAHLEKDDSPFSYGFAY